MQQAKERKGGSLRKKEDRNNVTSLEDRGIKTGKEMEDDKARPQKKDNLRQPTTKNEGKLLHKIQNDPRNRAERPKR